MKIDRLYTREGRDPFESMEFSTSSSVIRNPDGSVVFEWNEVTVPRNYYQIATDIIAQKYFRKAGIPRYLRPAKKEGQAVRQESWQEIESESLLLGKAVTTRRGPESWVVIRKDRR